MSERSRQGFKDGHRVSSNPRRWAGQFIALAMTDTGIIPIGIWWDEDRAEKWADRAVRIHPEWVVSVHEIQFKDFWLPRARDIEDTPDIDSIQEVP